MLDALHNYGARIYPLPDATLQKVLTLTYAPVPLLRQAARAYLIDREVLTGKLVDVTKAYVAAHAQALKASNSEGFVQLMIAVRDIYYNAGIKSLVDFSGDYGKRDRVPEAIKDSKRYFQFGIDLIPGLATEQNVPFGKSYYGMALALHSEAIVTDAERALGRGATSSQIDARIASKISSSEPIPFSAEGRSQFMSVIDRFMTLVAGRESLYLWPDHIAQLRTCRATPVYTCFRGSSAPPT